MEITDIVITIVISGGVGLTILFYQRKLGEKIDKLIIKQNQIIDEDHKREVDWKEVWGNRIIEDLSLIKHFHQILHGWLVDYINDRSEVNRKTLISSSERLGSIVDYHIQRLIENIPKIERYLKNPLLATLIIKQTDVYSTVFKVLNQNWIWNEEGMNGEIQSIEGYEKMLDGVIASMKNEIYQTSSQNNSKK